MAWGIQEQIILWLWDHDIIIVIASVLVVYCMFNVYGFILYYVIDLLEEGDGDVMMVD